MVTYERWHTTTYIGVGRHALIKFGLMTFEYSDSWLLQAIRLSEHDDKGATLIDIVKVADYTNRAIMTYSEFSTGVNKLKSIGLVTERNKRLLTTDHLKEWWTKKFDGKRKIGVHKGMDEILKYLNKTYGTVEKQMTKIGTEITDSDFDKATREYHKWFSDMENQTTTKKKVKG